jgi:hypothetical protein
METKSLKDSFLKNDVFCDVTPFGRVLRLLITANIVPNSSILVTIVLEEIASPETSVLIRAARRNIPEEGILHSHRRENLKS